MRGSNPGPSPEIRPAGAGNDTAPRIALRSIGLLIVLYFVQGLPFGFQTAALSPYLRSRGVSLTEIGLVGLVALPWALKALWAPLVDRYSSPRVGRRRSWILPMQALLALTCVAASFVPLSQYRLLLVLVGLMNLWAATMDIAVDGLAVDLLRDRELGMGNTVQVVGYRVGMLVGGGVLLWLSQWIGANGHFLAMAALVGTGLVISLLNPEPPGVRAAEHAHSSVQSVLSTLVRAALRDGGGTVIALVATYKLGESLVDAMFPPFLIDRGIGRETVGLWIGAYGILAAIGGSFLGGWLATVLPIRRAMALAGFLRGVPIIGMVLLTRMGSLPEVMVIGVVIAEHVFAGALTVTMFAFMMSRVDPRVGASHYTLLATIEVLGKGTIALASGALTEHALGYTGLFVVGVSLSLGWAVFAALVPLGPRA